MTATPAAQCFEIVTVLTTACAGLQSGDMSNLAGCCAAATPFNEGYCHCNPDVRTAMGDGIDGLMEGMNVLGMMCGSPVNACAS